MSALDFLPVSPGPAPGPTKPAPARSSSSASGSTPGGSSFDALVNEKAQAQSQTKGSSQDEKSAKTGKDSEKDRDPNAIDAAAAAPVQAQDLTQSNATPAIASSVLAFLWPIQQPAAPPAEADTAEPAANTAIDPKGVGIKLDETFEATATSTATTQSSAPADAPTDVQGQNLDKSGAGQFAAAVSDAAAKVAAPTSNAATTPVDEAADAALAKQVSATDATINASVQAASTAAGTSPATPQVASPKGDAGAATPNGGTRGIADAARRQAWSELARALGAKEATNSAAPSGNATADVASSAKLQSAGQGGRSAAASTTAAVQNAAAPKIAAPAIAVQGEATVAPQMAGGRVMVENAPVQADDKPVHSQVGSADKAKDVATSDKAMAATLAASAFNNNDSQTDNGRGNGSGERSDTFASYAAAIGRGADQGIAAPATTTTGFPLHQVTGVVTTQTDASPLLGSTSASASASASAAAGSGSAGGAAASSSQMAAQIADTDAAQSVIRSMRLQWSGSTGEAQLRLQPEHLGQVLVSVRVDQGNVSATLQADSASAQQWIQTHQQELRQALQDQGLRVTQFNVTTNPDDRRQNASQQQDQQGNQQQQQSSRARNDRQNADGRIFEVRV